ncbi:MAG: hypothetical protein ABUT20_34850, partial [Bacteroidota bacterium]
RIGLATAREDQTRLGESFGMGVLVEQAALPENECVPPLIFSLAEVPTLPRLIPEWIKAHQVDVIISNWNELGMVNKEEQEILLKWRDDPANWKGIL